MATTTGLVLRLTISADGSVALEIGQSPARASALSLVILDTDDSSTIAAKLGMVDVLSTTLLANGEVTATDANQDGVLTAAATRMP
jgi:hypothetical protein